MKELKEQLERCKEWLKEEPDDIEVIEKVKELEEKINGLEEEKREEKKEEERVGLLNKIEGLEEEIFKLKREINSRVPYIKEFENEMLALREIDNSIKEVKVKVLYEKIEEYNKLVEDYKNRF